MTQPRLPSEGGVGGCSSPPLTRRPGVSVSPPCRHRAKPHVTGEPRRQKPRFRSVWVLGSWDGVCVASPCLTRARPRRRARGSCALARASLGQQVPAASTVLDVLVKEPLLLLFFQFFPGFCSILCPRPRLGRLRGAGSTKRTSGRRLRLGCAASAAGAACGDPATSQRR